jgi:hypothetical protein
VLRLQWSCGIKGTPSDKKGVRSGWELFDLCTIELAVIAMFIRPIVFALSCLLVASPCVALEMNVATDDNEKLAFVNLWGHIDAGDDQKFRNLIVPYLRSGYLIFKVNIFTTGGNVGAAMGIADQINILQTRTVAPVRFADIVDDQPVERTYPSCSFSENYDTPKVVEGYNWCTCASACFLIWASGITREGNHVGVHRIYFTDEGGKLFGQLSGPEGRSKYLQAQASFQAYMQKLNVPSTISDRLWATDSQNIHFLTKEELELMESTPYLEEQTLARCGPDRTIHMGPANGWTETQDIQHVNCYRAILKEFMTDGAKNYLTALGEVPPEVSTGRSVSVPVAPQIALEKHWNHNGSLLKLETDKATRRFVFTEPREGLRQVGVTQGMVAFEGSQSGDVYEGTAYVFSRICGPVGYPVSGSVARDERSIILKGYAPYVDAQCRRAGGRQGVLVFQQTD